MARPGRPSKLNEDTKKIVMQAIQAGLTYELAAQSAGITYATLRNWTARGEQAASGEYFDFLKDLKEAEGKGATRLIGLIQRAANEGQWTAAAWILERRYPESYGRQPKQPVELTGKDGGPIQTESVVSEKKRQKAFEDLHREIEAYRQGHDDSQFAEDEADPAGS